MPQKDPEAKRKYDRKRYLENTEAIKKRVREWGFRDRANHPEKHKERHRRFHLKILYNLTAEEALQIEEFEKSTNPILLGETNNGVDHDHTTGLVRGILESHTNRALGILEKVGKENTPKLLRALADFLENPPAIEVLKKKVYVTQRGKQREKK